MAYSDQQIQEWFAANPNMSTDKVARIMRENGVSINQVAQATGMSPERANRFYQDGTTNAQYSAQDIQQWFAANPDVPAEQVAVLMRDNNLTPAQVAAATGRDPVEVTQVYNQALGIIPEQIPAPSSGGATGLYGAESARMGGFQSALGALMEGAGTARGDIIGSMNQATGQINDSFGRGQAHLQPYQQAGSQALGVQGALSGAQGQAAFDAAYTQSPYIKFLQQQGEQGVTRNAAALGGLGGGNVQKELSRFNQGLAGQGLQQQIGNLGAISGMGLNASTAGANMAGQQGSLLSGVTSQAGRDMANIANSTGQQVGNYAYGTGNAMAGDRFNTGLLLAGNISNTANSMANLATTQGNNIGNAINGGASNLAGILRGAGVSQAEIARIIAMSQAQTAQNASGQYAGVQNTAYTPANNLQTFGQVAGGVGTMLGAL